VASGQLAPIEVPADAAAVSRVHAEVRVDEWNAFIVDRGSANGTFIRPPATTEWIKLEPGHAVKIVPGVAISIGPYEFTFEPALGDVEPTPRFELGTSARANLPRHLISELISF